MHGSKFQQGYFLSSSKCTRTDSLTLCKIFIKRANSSCNKNDEFMNEKKQTKSKSTLASSALELGILIKACGPAPFDPLWGGCGSNSLKMFNGGCGCESKIILSGTDAGQSNLSRGYSLIRNFFKKDFFLKNIFYKNI